MIPFNTFSINTLAKTVFKSSSSQHAVDAIESIRIVITEYHFTFEANS